MPHSDFNLHGLACYLDLTPQQVAKLADRGHLPGRKVGGEWKFSKADIHHWLERRIGLSDEEELLEVEGVLSGSAPGEEEISIADLLPLEAIAVPLPARTRSSVIDSMVELAARTGWLWDPQAMAEAIRSREEMHSTALGNGVALLHPRRPLPKILAQALVALGVTSTGIPFGADVPMTDVFFLIASTEDRGHLRTLARLSRILATSGFIEVLRGPRCPGGAAAFCRYGREDVGNALRGVPYGRHSSPSWNATEGVPYSRNTRRRIVHQPIMSSLTLHILLIGDTSRPEFRDACTALEERAQVTRFADVEAASVAVAESLPAPHGIVLAQAYPDQFSAVAIDRLRSLAPLARLIAILGSWCEGEPRSGHPLPGVIRMYWHQAAVRIRREFPPCFEAEGSAWRLPATATDEERLLASVRAPLPTRKGLVALWTRRPEMEGLLADACRRGGYSTAWLHPRQPARVQGAVAAIYDGGLLDAAGLAELSQLAAEVSPAPVLALLDAPRIQDVRLARTLGATVLAKPFRIDELLWLLPR